MNEDRGRSTRVSQWTEVTGDPGHYMHPTMGEQWSECAFKSRHPFGTLRWWALEHRYEVGGMVHAMGRRQAWRLTRTSRRRSRRLMRFQHRHGHRLACGCLMFLGKRRTWCADCMRVEFEIRRGSCPG
jgi:hypothetical protein